MKLQQQKQIPFGDDNQERQKQIPFGDDKQGGEADPLGMTSKKAQQTRAELVDGFGLGVGCGWSGCRGRCGWERRGERGGLEVALLSGSGDP